MGERHVFGAGPCCSKCGCNKASIEAGMSCLPSQWVTVPRVRPTVQVMDGETGEHGCSTYRGHVAHLVNILIGTTCPAPTPRAP